MADERDRFLISLYHRRPRLFSSQQVDRLQELAQSEGISFRRDPDADDANLSDDIAEIGKQFVGGVVEGAVIVDPFDEPTSMAGQLAKNIGSLLGFTGMIFGTGGLGGAIGAGVRGTAGAIAGAARLSKSAAVIAKGERLIEGASVFSRGISRGFRSVPLAVADKFMAVLGKQGAYRAAMESLRGAPMVEQLIHSGLHLGAASATASAKEAIRGEWDAVIESTLTGAALGGAFAGIGNIPWAKTSTTAKHVLNAAAGAMVQGLPSTIAEAPAPLQVEQYLLGAYFGRHSPSASRFHAIKFWSGAPSEYNRAGIETVPGFDRLPEKVAAEARLLRDEMLQPKPAAAIVFQLLRGLPGGGDLAAGFRYSATQLGDVVQHPDSQVLGRVEEKLPGNRFRVRDMATGKTTEVYAGEAVYPPKSLVLPRADAAETEARLPMDEAQDFEFPDITPKGRLTSVMERLLGKGAVHPKELLAHASNLDASLRKMMSEGTRPSFDAFITQLQDIAERAGGRRLTEREEGRVAQYFIERMHAIQSDERYLNENLEAVQYQIMESGRYRDADNNLRDGMRPWTWLEAAAGLKRGDLYAVRSRVGQRGVKTLKNLMNFEWADADWAHMMNRAAKDGYYLFSGNSEKSMLYFIKKNADVDVARLRQELREAIPDFDAQYKLGQEAAKTRFGLSSKQYEEQFFSNARYWEQYNGLPIGRLMDPQNKNFIQNALNFNKRVQIMLTQLYPLDPEVMSRKMGGKTGFTYVVVKDYHQMDQVDSRGERLEKESSDGAIPITRSFAEGLGAAIGHPSGAGFFKAFLAHPDAKYGTLLGKFAFHAQKNTPNSLGRAMEEAGIDMLIHESDAKQFGLRYSHPFDLKDGKLVFDRDPEIHEAPWDAIKMSFGISDRVKETLNHRTTLASQLTKTMTSDQVPQAVRKEVAEWLRGLSRGTDEANTAVRDWLKNPNQKTAGELIDKHFENIGVVDLLQAMKESAFLRPIIRRKILFDDITSYADERMMDAQEGSQEAALEEATSVLNFLKAGGAEDAVALSKFAKNTVDTAMLNFFIRRLTNPTVRHAAKAFMRTYSRDLQLDPTIALDDKTFFLDESFRDLIIPGITELGEPAEMTLEQQWGVLKSLEKLTAPQAEIETIVKRLADSGVDMTKTQGWYEVGKKISLAQAVEIMRKYNALPRITKEFLADKTAAEKSALLHERQLAQLPKEAVDQFIADRFGEAGGVGKTNFTPEEIALRLRWLEAKRDPKEFTTELAQQLPGESLFGEKAVETVAKIRKSLQAVVLRVPMDDISGAQALTFGGFTGMPGGGILISASNMRRLGGADLDIDTAFLYFGLPESLRNTLGTDVVRKAQELYQKKHKFADRLFFSKDPADLPLFDSPVGMFDPYHRAKIGYEVSKGRGRTMGAAVNARFLIGAMYDAARSGDGTFASSDDRYVWRLVPRKDDGVLFRAVAKSAINSAADVGKEGGMVDLSTLKAILWASGFERIEKVNRQSGEVEKEYVGESKLDTTTPELSDAQRRVVDEALKEFADRDVYSIVDFRGLSDVQRAFYGRNWQKGRRFNQEEIVAAAREYPAAFKDLPLSDVAATISRLEYRDSLLERFIAGGDLPYKFARDFNSIMAGIQRSGNEQFPFIENPNVLTFKQLNDRVNVMKAFWSKAQRDKYGNLYNAHGPRELARSREFRVFLNAMAKVNGYSDPAAYEVAYFQKKAENIAATMQKEGRTPEEIKAALSRIRGLDFRQPSTREMFIVDEMQRVNDFLDSRLHDLASLKNVEEYFEATGLRELERHGATGEKGTEKARAIIVEVGQIKRLYDTYWKQRMSEGRINETPGSYDSVIQEYLQYKQQRMNEATYLGLDSQAMGDFVDAVFLSTFKGGPETGFSRIAVDVVGDEVLANHAKWYGTSFQAMTSRTNGVSAATYIGHVNKIRTDAGQERVPDVVHYGITVPEFAEKTELSAKQAQLLAHLRNALKGRDNVTAAQLWGAMRNWFNVAQISDVNIHDVYGLLNRLNAMNRGTGFFKGLLSQMGLTKDYRGKGVPFRWWNTLKYEATNADEMGRSYMDFYANEVINEDGSLNLTRPLNHFNPLNGKLEVVYADVNMPMTDFHRLIVGLNARDQHIATFAAYAQKLHTDALQWAAKGIHEPGSGEDLSQTLFEHAVRFLEKDGSSRVLREALQEQRELVEEQLPYWLRGGREKRLERLRLNDAKFGARVAAKAGEYAALADKVVEFATPKGVLRMTAKDAIQRIRAEVEAVMGRAYDEWVRVRPEWVGRNLLFDKEGLPYFDTEGGLLKRFIEQGRLSPEKDNITFDESNLLAYVDNIHLLVADELPKFVGPTPKDVLGLQYGPVAESARVFPELANLGIPERRAFLSAYLRGMHKPQAIQEMRVGMKKGSPQLAGLERAAMDAATQSDSAEAAVDVLSYYSRKWLPEGSGHQSDPRLMLTKKEGQSQYQLDMAIARGMISPRQYLFYTHMGRYAPKTTPRNPGYWPHGEFNVEKLAEEIQREIENIKKEHGPDSPMAKRESEELMQAYERILAEDRNRDGFLSMPSVRGILDADRKVAAIKHLQELGGDRFVGNLQERSDNMGGYSYDISMIPEYFERLIAGTWNNVAAFNSKRIIERFERSGKMGEHTSAWGKWMRIYVRDGMGYPSLFTDEILSDPRLKLKQTPYYWLSDHNAFLKFTKQGKLARRLMGMDKATPAQIAALRVKLGRQPEKTDIQEHLDQRWETFVKTDLGKEYLAQKLKGFSNLEARYEMAALLFHSKTAVSNVLGGSTNNWVWTGARPIWNSWRPEVWKRINPGWDSMDKVYRFVSDVGAVEDFILHEGSILKQKFGGVRWAQFQQDVLKKLRKDPNMPDESLLALAKKYGLTEKFMRTSAVFMTKTERMLRTHAFLSSYLQARAMFEPLSSLEYDNPYIIELGKRGIEMTQFLYSNINRPAFARTHLGKVFTRFKLWTWSSVRFQRAVLDQAAFSGYRPGSVEMERYNRLITANMFALGLASLLPYTIFEQNLPAPLSYFQDLASWAFGDKRERERAFFTKGTGIPTALGPLALIAPPIMRVPKGFNDAFNLIWGGETERIATFTTYSLFPWGRLGNDVMRAWENPEMAVDWLTGLPLHQIARVKKRAQRGS